MFPCSLSGNTALEGDISLFSLLLIFSYGEVSDDDARQNIRRRRASFVIGGFFSFWVSRCVLALRYRSVNWRLFSL